MQLFTGLRKIREFERLQLPFIKSIVDFDIIVEIGCAEEEGEPLTTKRLLLLNISSRTTVRRKLAKHIEEGIVIRRMHATDQRAGLLVISPSSVKLISKYAAAIALVSASHFK
jgi:DNA-binding MarR family transcriptional regulator